METKQKKKLLNLRFLSQNALNLGVFNASKQSSNKMIIEYHSDYV